MTNAICRANPPHPARPPSARFSRRVSCGGGDRVSMLIAAAAVGSRSADRRRVLDSALVPELVDTARDLKLGAGADIAIEGFPVIADRLDDLQHPILGDAKRLAEIAVDTEHALELRLIRFRHLVDVL